jgi:chaperonin GroEL (HSP60 family)
MQPLDQEAIVVTFVGTLLVEMHSFIAIGKFSCDSILIATYNVAGPNDHTIAQIKDAVRDGLRAVKNTIEDESVVLVSFLNRISLNLYEIYESSTIPIQ